jgi:hypothetical protein
MPKVRRVPDQAAPRGWRTGHGAEMIPGGMRRAGRKPRTRRPPMAIP